MHEATDNLINQQFYRNGTDRINGRTQDVSVKIRNSGKIIGKFKAMFNKHMDLFLEERYLEFLSIFKNIKGLENDSIIQEIHAELDIKLEALKNTDIDIIVLYTVVVSALISRIRKIHFDETVEEIKKRSRNKASSPISEKFIQEELNNLYMKNNDNISILYNISYLDALAESFNYHSVANTLKIQKGKYMNNVVNIILKAHKAH